MMDKSTLSSYINSIAQRLGEPNIYGSASVMVGAGFSKNAKNIGEDALTPPDWSELAGFMYNELYQKPVDEDYEEWQKQRLIETSGKNVLHLAEKYEATFDRQKLNNLIERNISDDNYIPGELHQKLLELNWNDVFTTNYDTLLEKTISKISTKFSYKVIYSQNDLPGSVRPRIVKLHGSIKHANSYIITEEDYRTYPIKYTPFVNTVQQSMLETRLCLIGFSGDDPNFLNWLGWLRDNMGESCPQIYLCGLFDKMSDAERKVLESKKIAIIDLSLLVDEKVSNKYYYALNSFFDQLKKLSAKKEYSNIQNPINFIVSYKDDINNYKDYYDKMIEFTEKVKSELIKYISYPIEYTTKFIPFISGHFNAILHDEDCEKKFTLVGNLSFIMRRLHIVLYDNNAIKLEELIEKNKDNDNNNKLIIWFDIALYLLEMYRIDNDIEKYCILDRKVDAIHKKLPINKVNDYMIEKTKHAISIFDFDNACEYIEKIEVDEDYEISIKKAGLYCQISKKDKSLEILSLCLAKLVQQKYSENIMASIIGYINLCARAVIPYVQNSGKYSDERYTDNIFNTRKIVINARDYFIDKIFENENDTENLQKKPSFNPNSYTYSYSIESMSNQNTKDFSFRYLLLLDDLCIPVLNDQKRAVESAINKIMFTSKSANWKWKMIIRINDEKLINSFFTRERIANANLSEIKLLFNELISLFNKFTPTDDFKNANKIINQSVIINALSRFSIVMDDNEICMLLNKICEVSSNISDSWDKTIKEAIDRISYSFNKNILEKSLECVFEKFNSRFHIASYFETINYITINKDTLKRIIDETLIDIREANITIRDNGLSKLILLNNCGLLKGYDEEIKDIIWEQIGPNNFPKSDLYLPTAWEELPSNGINFYDKYKNYLENPSFVRCVQSGVISSYMNTDIEIFAYLNCFYKVTVININRKNPILLGNITIKKILSYLYDYLDNEKSLIDMKYDIFGESTEAKKRFKRIGELVSLLYVVGNIEGCWNDDLESIVEDIMDLYKKLDISSENIRIVKNINKKDFKDCFDEIEQLILTRNNEEVSMAFICLNGVLRILENENKAKIITPNIQNLVKNLPYIDVSIAKYIILHLNTFTKRKLFTEKRNKNLLINALTKCFNIYKKGIEKQDKNILDTLYNLSSLLYSYYNYLVDNKIIIEDNMKKLISDLKNVDLNEIRNIWVDINL